MGRFSALEFNEAPQVEVEQVRQVKGEVIKDAQYFISLGERHFYRMEYEEALKNFSSAASTDPGAIPAWLGQVHCLIQLSEFREAELWVKKAMELVGENADFLALHALGYARKGDFDRACGYSDASTEAAGNSSLPYIVRGEIFLYARRNSEYCFEQACTLATHQQWRTRFLIADGCLFSKKRAGALIAYKYLQPALDTDGHRIELQLQMVRVLIAQGKTKAAGKLLEEIEFSHPELTSLKRLKRQLRKPGFFAKLFGRGKK